MTGTPDSEGLIPVEAQHISPVSPVHTSERTTHSHSPPLSDVTSPHPVPEHEHERTRPEDAPMPVISEPISEMSEKQYAGQPSDNEPHPAFAGQMNSASNEKAYPGQPSQPIPDRSQPQAYYTPFGQSTNYATAVPLHALQSAPCPVDCPACGQREMTKTLAVSGGTTHAWAAVLCFCCCLGCIPYLISSLKDVEHSCGKCGVKLARWHNSGRVEVFQSERPSAGIQQSNLGANAQSQPQIPDHREFLPSPPATLSIMIRLIVAISALLTGSSAVYFYIFHQNLSSRIQHISHCGRSSPKSKPISIDSVPDCAFTNQCFSLHDRASKSVTRGALPNIPTEILLTKLARRNMTVFSHFPQALMIRLVCHSPETKQSFKASHIESLDFDKGDLVCGAYRVIARSSNKVEFEMKMENMEFMNGRLALSVQEKGEEVVFTTETMMWKLADEMQAMPLEKPLLRWMHETATWWLIDSGVRYLTELECN
ncbi:hypothetical protein N7490_000771 [Penicillium lividum]|nr:hypothetical protein N7490_000771 [Penicillium lividum]